MEGAILDGIPQHAISWLMRLIDARAPSVGAIECSLNMGSMSLRSEKTLQSSTLLAVTRDGPEFAYGTVHSLGSANVDLYFPVERICPQMREGRFVLDVRGLHPVLYESYIFEDASLLLLKSTSNRYGEILKELHVLKVRDGNLVTTAKNEICFLPDCPFCKARKVHCECPRALRQRASLNSAKFLEGLRTRGWHGSTWEYFSKWIAPWTRGYGVCNVQTFKRVRDKMVGDMQFSLPYRYFFSTPSAADKVDLVQRTILTFMPPTMSSQIPSSPVSGSPSGLDRLNYLQLSSSMSSEAEYSVDSHAAAENDYVLPRFEVKIEEIAEGKGLDSDAYLNSSESPPAQTHQKEPETFIESFDSPPVQEGSPPKRNRTEKERPRCAICNATYVSNSAVRRHFRTVHEKRWKYECSCGKRFYHQSDYYRHQAGKNHDKKLPRTGQFSNEIS
ncbi:hypothetical protein NDN08_002640 [Rhodosorus marinus]|uniref:C2H2-type domain-containing protein n=1 Tax=Rhodosorus marinus TaxID=101924 RepID=A0AAV8UVR1_9RHOD|nr:hypothetical protein NDN08_002640 [Rhodosorus marinus]